MAPLFVHRRLRRLFRRVHVHLLKSETAACALLVLALLSVPALAALAVISSLSSSASSSSASSRYVSSAGLRWRKQAPTSAPQPPPSQPATEFGHGPAPEHERQPPLEQAEETADASASTMSVAEAEAEAEATPPDLTAELQASCSHRLLVAVRTSGKTYTERAPHIIRTWVRDFPRDRVVFLSADPLPDYGARQHVMPVLRTDPYYGHTYAPDAIGAPFFLEEMDRLGAEYVFIVDDDTYVFGENLCRAIEDIVAHAKGPFVYSGFSFCMDKPYGALKNDKCIKPPQAPRPIPTHKPCSVGFAYGGGGVLMNKPLVKALASVADECWEQTQCIRGGSLRTWWCMYFHPEVFHGKEQRMDFHWTFFPNRPAFYLQTMGAKGRVQSVAHNSTTARPATFHHVHGAEQYWLYSVRLQPRLGQFEPRGWRGQVTMNDIFGHPPPWSSDCAGSVFRKSIDDANNRQKRLEKEKQREKQTAE